MNASQIHLALNHVPLFFSITGGLILLFGFIKKNDEIKVLSLYFNIAAALFVVPVYLTGDGTEEMIEHLPGVSENFIQEHEELAEIGLIIIIASGVVALSAFFLKKKASIFKTALYLSIILSFTSFGIMAQTAHLGGQIRHSELRSSSVSGENKNGEKENEDIKKEVNDDDD